MSNVVNLKATCGTDVRCICIKVDIEAPTCGGRAVFNGCRHQSINSVVERKQQNHLCQTPCLVHRSDRHRQDRQLGVGLEPFCCEGSAQCRLNQQLVSENMLSLIIDEFVAKT